MDDSWWSRMAKRGYLGTGPLMEVAKYGNFNPFRASTDQGTGDVGLALDALKAPGLDDEQQPLASGNVRSRKDAELNEKLLNQGYNPDQILQMESDRRSDGKAPDPTSEESLGQISEP